MALLVRDNAMGHPPFVIRIQKFLGTKMFLFASLNKLWRGLYVRKMGNTMEDWNRTLTKAMAMLDSVPLLELASNYGLDLQRFFIFQSSNKCSWESEASRESSPLAWWAGKIAHHGVIIRYGQLSSESVRHLCNGAAFSGRLETLKELYDHHSCEINNDKLCLEAACAPTVDVLKWLNDQNIGKWDEESMNNMMTCAAGFGHIPVVQWLHEDKGVALLSAVSNAAASNNRLDFLRYRSIIITTPNDSKIISRISSDPSRPSYYPTRWMLEKYSWPMSHETCLNAALAKKPDVLQWLKENNVGHWDKESLQDMIRRSAEGGGIETASWLRNDCGAEWDDKIVFAALNNDQIEFVKWCKRHACPWGDLDCLKLSQSGASNNTFDELHTWRGWDGYKCDCGGVLRGLGSYGGKGDGLDGYEDISEEDNYDEGEEYSSACFERDHHPQ